MPNRLKSVSSKFFPARLGPIDAVSVFATSTPVPARDALSPSVSGTLVMSSGSLPKNELCLASDIGTRIENSTENFWAWSLGVSTAPTAETAEVRIRTRAKQSSVPESSADGYFVGNLWKGAERLPELALTMGFGDPSLELIVATRESARIERSLISDLASVALSKAYQSAEKLWEEDKESVTLLDGELQITCVPVVFFSTPIAMPLIAQLQRYQILVPKEPEVMGTLGHFPSWRLSSQRFAEEFVLALVRTWSCLSNYTRIPKSMIAI